MLLRILTLPIAMTAFIVLYVLANKLPSAVETANLVVWIVLPLILIIRFLSKSIK
jgi:hypothetical protein